MSEPGLRLTGREGVPEGWRELADVGRVYVREDGAVVVTGYPEEEDERHNCDEMGCGAEHVILRARLAEVGTAVVRYQDLEVNE